MTMSVLWGDTRQIRDTSMPGAGTAPGGYCGARMKSISVT